MFSEIHDLLLSVHESWRLLPVRLAVTETPTERRQGFRIGTP